MQIRAAAPVARRPLVAQAPRAAAAPARPALGKPVKAQTDAGFGSDIFQGFVLGLTNLGTLVKLPGGLSGLIQALPASSLGAVNAVMGGLKMFQDVRGLKKDGNTKKSDDYIRIGSDAALLVGGAGLIAGAAIAPWVPLVGAGIAVAGYAGRMVGVWQDETRW